jgi:hypothetical protein
MANERQMMMVGNMVPVMLTDNSLYVWTVQRHGAEMRWLLQSTDDAGTEVLVTKDLLGSTCRIRVVQHGLLLQDVVAECSAAEAWQKACVMMMKAKTQQAV